MITRRRPPMASYWPSCGPTWSLQLDEAYTNPADDVLDDYRCFAFPLDIDAPQFVTGYEFIPDVAGMAHHNLLYLFDERAERARFKGAMARTASPAGPVMAGLAYPPRARGLAAGRRALRRHYTRMARAFSSSPVNKW